MTNKPPPLQNRIVTVLDNPNASASELSELVAETELAIVAAEQTIASERAKAAEAQNNVATTRLNAGAKTASRTAQQYALLQQPTFSAQSDAVQVLAFLLAGQAASTSPNKAGAVGLIIQIADIATEALEEIYGYRPIVINRPDPDQIATLISQIAAARASAGLAVLPHYSDGRTSWSPL